MINTANKTLIFIMLGVLLVMYILTLKNRKIQTLNIYAWPLGSYVEDCSTFEKGTLNESSSPQESSEECWWLDSGGVFTVSGGTGQTLKKELPLNSVWQTEYFKTNPKDTDQGMRPQNIFRLINRKMWKDVSIQTLFKVETYNSSRSENENESNGVLLMSRYTDSANLYYAGVRVDGTAVIKKKMNGIYTTLASKEYVSLDEDGEKNKILLPMNQWIGEKFITSNNLDGSVNLKLQIDLSGNGTWQTILETNDNLKSSGSPPLGNEGSVGLRSDFMDIEFSNFKVESLEEQNNIKL